MCHSHRSHSWDLRRLSEHEVEFDTSFQRSVPTEHWKLATNTKGETTMTYTRPEVLNLGNAEEVIERVAGIKQGPPKDSSVDLKTPPAYDLDE